MAASPKTTVGLTTLSSGNRFNSPFSSSREKASSRSCRVLPENMGTNWSRGIVATPSNCVLTRTRRIRDASNGDRLRESMTSNASSCSSVYFPGMLWQFPSVGIILQVGSRQQGGENGDILCGHRWFWCHNHLWATRKGYSLQRATGKHMGFFKHCARWRLDEHYHIAIPS